LSDAAVGRNPLWKKMLREDALLLAAAPDMSAFLRQRFAHCLLAFRGSCRA
jgi:hypothetical protein